MGRSRKNIPVKKIKFIYCEGESEEKYFYMLNQKYNGSNIKIKNLGKGQLEFVNDVIKHHKYDQADEVYAAFDADDMDNQEIDKCFKQCSINGINILFSNVCFEVWLLLHYEYFNMDYTRDILYQKLEKHMELNIKYTDFKGQSYVPYLMDKVNQAIQNISKLSTGNNYNKYSNPYSTIDDRILKKIFDTPVL